MENIDQNSSSVWVMLISTVKMFVVLCLMLIGKDALAFTDQIKDNSSSPELTSHLKLSFGDMKLTPIQEFAVNQKNVKFNAIPGANMRWKDGIIPYEIDCSIENLESATAAVEAAMKEWEAKTCIRFVRRRHQEYYLTFFRDTHYHFDGSKILNYVINDDMLESCWGHVGQVRDAKISVGYGCEFRHVMVHEIGHAVGLYHEHNRPDRDDWVKVKWENIGGFRDAFKIQANSESLGVSYDYSSIMHYPWTAFSANGRETMEPRRARRGKIPYVELSRDDVTLVSRMYNCPAIERKRGKRSVEDEPAVPVAPVANDDHPCQDTHPDCLAWRDAGHCELSEAVRKACPRSCRTCPGMERVTTVAPGGGGSSSCHDTHKSCLAWRDAGYCVHESVQIACPRSCRTCPGATKPPTMTPPTTKPPPPTAPPYVTKSFKHWYNVWPNRNNLGIGRLCIDLRKECWEWASHGQCDSNPFYMLRWCMKSCRRMGAKVACDPSKVIPAGECNNPLGLGMNEDGSSKLPNSAFRASASLRAGGGWSAPAHRARLYNTDDFNNKEIGAWCAPNAEGVERWVQVDLQTTKTVKYIATQGRPQYFERVSEFQIQYSNNGRDFKTYKEDGKPKQFYGNCDHVTPTINRFKNPIKARFIRYLPWKWNFPCARLELFGC